jgi:GNAT superfamily N-acetyltransferase
MSEVVAAVSIREARESDAAALYDAWLAVRQHYAAVDGRIVPAAVSREEFGEGLSQRIARPEAVTFVAVAGAHVVGFITGGIEPGQPDRLPAEHATIGHLFVDPSRRRQGIGAKLVRAVTEWARSHEGVGHFEMTVLDADDDAREFWAAIGFRPFIQRLWAPIDTGRNA